MKIAMLAACLSALLCAASAAATVRIDKDNRWIVGGKSYFALGLSGAPPADLKTPDGKDGWAELASGGVNWTYWYDVLKPLFKEIGPGSEVYQVMTAPSSDDVKIGVQGASDIEVLARKVNGRTYILAAKREGDTVKASLTGLSGDGEADVLQENRKVPVKWGVIEDEFKPNSVHVYRLGE